MKPGLLTFSDGSRFPGLLPDWFDKPCEGELVFTTGMTGYPEALTDPSFSGQILLFTYPLMGNYGVPPKSSWESDRIQVRGALFGSLSSTFSHSRAERSLAEWMRAEGVPFLTGADTREITKKLRERGSSLGCLSEGAKGAKELFDPDLTDLAREVAAPERELLREGGKKVVLVDCGMKRSIARRLAEHPLHLLKVPYDDDFTEEEFDAVLVSNGPGNPKVYRKTVSILKKALLKKKPLFGICLGAQLLALAAGAETYKLPYGHRGQNQPCMHLGSRRCYLTSQNHGYAIDARTLPQEWAVSWVNLNDGSVAGIEHKKLPFSAVQFHPEASPGPLETAPLFEEFLMRIA